jgi:hypothetical protein
MKELLMPVIAFVIGLLSLFIDSKDKKKRWVFIFFLVVTVSATITFNLIESKKKEAAITEARQKEENLTQILLNITANTKQIPDIVNLLMSQGYTKSTAENATTGSVTKSINASQLFNKYLSRIDYRSASLVRVEYFPKDVDGKTVLGIIKNAGFKVVTKQPKNNLKTNAIWAGNDVSTDEIKVIALALSQAGVELVSISRFANGRGDKARLIQVGSDPENLRKKPLSLDYISDLNI